LHHLRGQFLLLVLHRRHRAAHPELTITETIMNARLILYSVLSTTKASTMQFYTALLGTEFGRSLWDEGDSSYAWASSGVKLTVNQAPHERGGVMPHFRVDDLDDALKQLEAAGGHQVAGPYDIPVAAADLEGFRTSYAELGLGSGAEVEPSLGSGAVVRDPDGNQVGLIQLRPFAEAFFEGGVVTRHEQLQHQVGMRNNAR
jgi:predicted enzyme related to lactoylglutathione lyase